LREEVIADTTRSAGHDPDQVFNIASHFAESAALLHRATTQVLSGPERTVQLPFLIPAIVCSAFSVELFMKCLIMVEKGDPPWKHSLRLLYSQLSHASRAAIARRFGGLMQAYPIDQAMRAQAPQVSFAIDDVLNLVDKVFEQFRYPYAYQGEIRGAYGLGELAQAVRERIVELRSAAE
jgi:hypothetical protein